MDMCDSLFSLNYLTSLSSVNPKLSGCNLYLCRVRRRESGMTNDKQISSMEECARVRASVCVCSQGGESECVLS